MYDVVAVAFNMTKSIYFFSPNDLVLKKGDKVIVETENGLQCGVVKSDIRREKKENLVLPLKRILRIATKMDLLQVEENEKKASKALRDAKKFSKDLNLDMNFVDAYFTFDKNQLVFSFLSDNRVDFRDLAKKLAQKYKTRIELRQIGVRDKAKKIGGLGPCGLFLCCNSFLTDFNSVSINMAKNQFLALNPSKINGICGRLLCCLGYEDDIYTELKKGLPHVGMVADTEMGMGKVVSVDVFKGTYSVDLKEKGIITFSKDKKNGSIE